MRHPGEKALDVGERRGSSVGSVRAAGLGHSFVPTGCCVLGRRCVGCRPVPFWGYSGDRPTRSIDPRPYAIMILYFSTGAHRERSRVLQRRTHTCVLQRLRRTSRTLKNLVKYLTDNAVMRGRAEVARDEAETNPASKEKKPMGQPYQVSNKTLPGHESGTGRTRVDQSRLRAGFHTTSRWEIQRTSPLSFCGPHPSPLHLDGS